MKLSSQGVAFLVDYEKREPRAYKDSAEKWTWGIGHLITDKELASGIVEIAGVKKKWREAILTDALMDALFAQDLAPRELQLNALLTREPTQQQYDAMFCLLYNIGVGSADPKKPGGFTRSTVRRLSNAGDIQGAADAFLMWNKAKGKISAGLVKRRAQERAMFLDGNYNSEH